MELIAMAAPLVTFPRKTSLMSMKGPMSEALVRPVSRSDPRCVPRTWTGRAMDTTEGCRAAAP